MKLYDLFDSKEYLKYNETVFDVEINHIASKIEEITSDSLFFLIESIKVDVKNIIDYIREKTPLAIVCSENLKPLDLNAIIIYVENPRKAMATAFSRFWEIDYKKTKFIAVTGTNGKTTSATLIKKILEYDGKKVGFFGTGIIESCGKRINEEFYSMTTPDPPLLYKSIRRMQDDGAEYIVMEASSHALFFDKLSPITFELSAFTNLTEEHLDFHENTEEYFKSKLKLFENTKTGVFNIDDRHGKIAFREVKCQAKSIGIIWPADAVAREITLSGLSGASFIYKEQGVIFRVKTQLIGAYNVYNVLLALKCALLLGIKPCIAKKAVFSVAKIDGRFEITSDSVNVIKDYAHTPAALDNLLKTVNSLKKPEQKLILVFGCGGERDKYKRPIMGALAEENADFTIITSDNSRNEKREEILRDIASGFKKTDRRIIISDRAEAIRHAILYAKSGDVIVVAGKGAENYIIDDTGIHHFSEDEIINDALEKRRKNNEN